MELLPLILPYVLLLARVSGFFAILPLFAFPSVPLVVRAGLVMAVSVFLAAVTWPVMPDGLGSHWLAATLAVIREVICGVVLGLVARLVYTAIHQGGWMISQQMGFMDAGVIDPTSEESSTSLGVFFEMAFALLFLAAGGHQLLVMLVVRSYQLFPIGEMPSAAVMADAVVQAGSAMLLFGLKLAAPMLAAFLVLAVVLAVLARVLPEMNILIESYPLRVGLGLFLAAAMIPTVSSLAEELANWMSQSLLS